MATSLIAEFVNANNEKQSITWANIDPETPNSDVKFFLNGVVSASSSLLKVALTACTSAKMRTTTDTEISLSS